MSFAPRPPFLCPEDGAPFELYHPERQSQWLLVCDHARNRVPACLGNMGCAPEVFEQHIAYDIGAEGVTRHLADLLEAPAIIHGFCRLVADPNNHPNEPWQIPEIACDGTEIPANHGLTENDKRARLDAVFRPYHRAIADKMAALRAQDIEPKLLSIHSCTPELNGHARPWHVGVLWNQDDRLAKPLITALEAQGDILVGDNQPYSLRERRRYTTEVHAEDLGLLSVLVEVRQDLIATDAQQKAWAERLLRALT